MPTTPSDFDLDLSTASLADLEGVLGRDKTRLYIAQQNLDTARAQDARIRRDLGIGSGLDDADLAEASARLDMQLTPKLRAAELEASKAAREVQARARKIAEVASVNRPKLSASDMTLMGHHLPLLQAQVASLRPADLVKVGQAALLADDQPAMLAFATLLRAGIGGTGDAQAVRSSPDGREIDRLVRVIDEKLRDPAFDALRDKALALADEAGVQAWGAEKPAHDARLATRPFPFQKPTDVPWSGA